MAMMRGGRLSRARKTPPSNNDCVYNGDAMTIEVQVSPAVLEWLAAQAGCLGLSVEQYAAQVITEALGPTQPPTTDPGVAKSAELRSLMKETQSLPQIAAVTDEDIAAAILDSRRSRELGGPQS